MSTREQVVQLFYHLDAGVQAGLGDDPRPIDEVLRIHLLTENLLEKLISLSLGVHAEAVLTAKLTYAQKLAICGKLKLDDGSEVLSSDVKGSLKKLNVLRNDVAHDLTHETTDEDVESLFVGQMGNKRQGPALHGDVWQKLSSYKATIFVEMLNPDFANADQQQSL